MFIKAFVYYHLSGQLWGVALDQDTTLGKVDPLILGFLYGIVNNSNNNNIFLKRKRKKKLFIFENSSFHTP